MYSVAEILQMNKHYNDESQKLHELWLKTKEANEQLDLEEVKNNLNYSESKKLYEILFTSISNKEKCEELKQIVYDKKVEEYPQIKDVHYYPKINDIDFLDKDAKIKLDILLKEAYQNSRKQKQLTNVLDNKTIDFLIDNNIIERLYLFYCDCDNSFDCLDKIITQEQFDTLQLYWHKAAKGITTDEEDEYMRYGCFEVSCANDNFIEISCLSDFNKYLKRIEFKVKEKPDTTLDKI